MLGILVAAISGAIMSVQGVFNAEVTKQTSIWLSSAFVQISAFVVCVLAWFITGRDGAISSLSSGTDLRIFTGKRYRGDYGKGIVKSSDDHGADRESEDLCQQGAGEESGAVST